MYSKPLSSLTEADAASFEQDEEIAMMNWGNAFVRKITRDAADPKLVTGLEVELHLQGDVKKTKKKITWLSTEQETGSTRDGEL